MTTAMLVALVLFGLGLVLISAALFVTPRGAHRSGSTSIRRADR